jgi:hypothetical protein
MVQNPGLKPKLRNIVNSEAPNTNSGVAIGKKIRVLTKPRPLNAYRASANAIKVPKNVAPTVAINPILIELPKAEQISIGLQGFFQLSKVKLFHTKLLLTYLLNEKTKV